jgi:hypothetical protein
MLDRPSESRGLASHQELAREHARARLVLERIRAADSLGACRPQDLAMLVRFERFLRLRAMSPGLARAAAVIQQFALGRYSQYARGWRTAAADLFLTRG